MVSNIFVAQFFWNLEELSLSLIITYIFQLNIKILRIIVHKFSAIFILRYEVFLHNT